MTCKVTAPGLAAGATDTLTAAEVEAVAAAADE